jgi:hypothetical protein
MRAVPTIDGALVESVMVGTARKSAPLPTLQTRPHDLAE